MWPALRYRGPNNALLMQGWCETRINVSPALQQHGFVHAGVLMTIADHTCGGAAASTMPDDKDVITKREQNLVLATSIKQDANLPSNGAANRRNFSIG
jgi:acyl-coenzyme A thioesterase PaaI-like protein